MENEILPETPITPPTQTDPNVQYLQTPLPYHRHNGVDSAQINAKDVIGFIFKPGSPTSALVAKAGTIYIQTDAVTATSRMWISTGTNWGYVTTSA